MKLLLPGDKRPLISGLSLLEQGHPVLFLLHPDTLVASPHFCAPLATVGRQLSMDSGFPHILWVWLPAPSCFVPFFKRVSTEQTDDRDSVFPREGQNFLSPVAMMSISMAKAGVSGLHPTREDCPGLSLLYCSSRLYAVPLCEDWVWGGDNASLLPMAASGMGCHLL